jgi:hypothetical protein
VRANHDAMRARACSQSGVEMGERPGMASG